MDGDDTHRSDRSELRAVATAQRRLGHTLIVARPSDGAPVVLPSTAATVLDSAHDWTSVARIDAALAESFPAVADDERRRTLATLVDQLNAEGLLERR
jgi:hypothetical protein